MNILADLLSSHVKAEVFRLLFGLRPEPVDLRELERRSGLAVATVRQELNKLKRLGLIEARPDGNRTYFSALQDHPLYTEIHGLVLKTIGLADVLHRALEKEKRIDFAFIFGSVAQAREQAQSDIDLLVVGEVGLRDVTRLLSGVSDKVGREINPKVFTQREFARRRKTGDHFLSRVLGEPRIFVVGNENELRKLA